MLSCAYRDVPIAMKRAPSSTPNDRGERNSKRFSEEDQGDGGSKSRELAPTETDSDSEGERELSQVEIRLADDYIRDFERVVAQPNLDEEDEEASNDVNGGVSDLERATNEISIPELIPIKAEPANKCRLKRSRAS